MRWEREILRNIFGPVCEDGIRSNLELETIYGIIDINLSQTLKFEE